MSVLYPLGKLGVVCERKTREAVAVGTAESENLLCEGEKKTCLCGNGEY